MRLVLSSFRNPVSLNMNKNTRYCSPEIRITIKCNFEKKNFLFKDINYDSVLHRKFVELEQIEKNEEIITLRKMDVET